MTAPDNRCSFCLDARAKDSKYCAFHAEWVRATAHLSREQITR